MVTDEVLVPPVKKSVTVRAGQAHAFDVFTAGFDGWWPRGHHIGKAPMKRAIIEGKVGGRCYTEQTDGTDCDWGTVLAWEPPARFVLAWQIRPDWEYEPNLDKSSEVEVRFTPLADGTTRVDLEHRHFNRHGSGGAAMRQAVESPSGWADLLGIYRAHVDPTA